MFGNAAEGLAPVTASARSLPALICSISVGIGLNARGGAWTAVQVAAILYRVVGPFNARQEAI
jgi:hypothetical protein